MFQSDGGQIVGRLMQIRDYIKQAKSMMEALNKSGSQVRLTTVIYQGLYQASQDLRLV